MTMHVNPERVDFAEIKAASLRSLIASSQGFCLAARARVTNGWCAIRPDLTANPDHSKST